MTCLISSRIGDERIRTNGEFTWGQANYSWKIVADLYQRSFDAVGLPNREVIRPEIYTTKRARQVADIGDNDFHFAVKPIEHIRRLPGIANVASVGWEFPEFNNRVGASDPFRNQRAILGHLDSIFCWTKYAQKNLENLGFEQAVTLPPAVGIQNSDAFQVVKNMSALSLDEAGQNQPVGLYQLLEEFSPSKVFLSVLNPWDKRKHFKEMVEGFAASEPERHNSVLIIKVIIDNEGTRLINLHEIIQRVLGAKQVSSRIICVVGNLSRREMMALGRSADFYLCTSSTEGLNLPLIEFGLIGVIPVTPLNSAMGSYLTDKHCIAIQHSSEKAPCNISHLGDDVELTHFPVTSEAVSESVVKAIKLSNADQKKISTAIKSRLYDEFGIVTFAKRFESWKSNTANLR